MRRPDVQGLRRDLRRAELLAERARNLLGEGAEHVDSARALLAEAQQWLPHAGKVKPLKLRVRLPPRPEILLFQACSLLLLVGRRLDREVRARRSFAELVRVRELVNAAFHSLREAWLAHLYAHGLPPGYKPVRTLYKSGGMGIYFLFALAVVFVDKLTKDVFPKDEPVRALFLGNFLYSRSRSGASTTRYLAADQDH